MKGFVVNGKEFLIANIEGTYYAIGSVCTHMGCPLDKGSLNEKIVTCLCHGSQFDVTDGKVLKSPATKDEPKYGLKVVGKDIFVTV